MPMSQEKRVFPAGGYVACVACARIVRSKVLKLRIQMIGSEEVGR
jgi:hypothetical protein